MKSLAVLLWMCLTPQATAQNRVELMGETGSPGSPKYQARVNASGALEIACVSGCSGAAAGATTVTPGTGTWSVSLSSNGTFTAPFYIISTNTVVSTGSVTAFAPSAAQVQAATAFLNARLTDGAAFYKGTTPSDTQPISAASLPLPTGAATETTLGGVKTGTDRIPAQGQALAANSTPVVLTAAQVTTLTPPAAITNFANETGGNLASLVAKDFATQTTLSALNAKVTAVNTGAVVFNGAQPVSGPATNTEIRASPLPVAVVSSSGGFVNPYYVISTNTVISTGSVTAFLATGTNIIGRVNGSTIAVQCLNAAGTAFESCAGGGSSGGVVSVFITSGTPYIQSSTTLSVSLSSLSYTGTSANVNCTGGCGSPTQAASFIAVATATLATGATHFTLFNHSGSTAIIKVQRVEVGVYGDAAVTGVVTGFHMYLITNATTTTSSIAAAKIHRLDTTKNAIAPNVTLSTGGSASNPAISNGNTYVFGGVQMTSEETTLAETAQIFDYRNLGDTPLRLGAGNGFAVKQAGQPVAAAGKVIIRAFFTQE